MGAYDLNRKALQNKLYIALLIKIIQFLIVKLQNAKVKSN